jgi:hypothetical protein
MKRADINDHFFTCKINYPNSLSFNVLKKHLEDEDLTEKEREWVEYGIRSYLKLTGE